MVLGTTSAFGSNSGLLPDPRHAQYPIDVSTFSDRLVDDDSASGGAGASAVSEFPVGSSRTEPRSWAIAVGQSDLAREEKKNLD